MNALLVGRGVRRVFAGGDGQPLEVLRGIDMEVRRGEFVAIALYRQCPDIEQFEIWGELSDQPRMRFMRGVGQPHRSKLLENTRGSRRAARTPMPAMPSSTSATISKIAANHEKPST